MRIDNQMLPACCHDATAAEKAVVQEMQGAAERLRQTQNDKQQARADKLEQARRTTSTLRQIATQTRNAGLVDFALDLGSLAFGAGGSKGADRLLAASKVFNLCRNNIKNLEAQISAHNARHERAAGVEELAKDAASEAKRLADASLQRLETMQRIGHEGQLAILHG